ncbi:MAG: SAM-dependent methyltransferase [Candidatus Micrarchaeota archaeon]
MFERPLPFQRLQERMNSSYYSKREPSAATPEDRLGFGTPSHDLKYIEAHAREFIDYATRKTGELHVHEFGIADGTFAKGFLDYLRKHSPEVYSRTHYHAWDKAPALLKAAKKVLGDHEQAFVGEADVEKLGSEFNPNSADFVYCHELFDDLPTRIVSRKNDKIKELWFKPMELRMGEIRGISIEAIHRDLEFDEHVKHTRALMKRIPESIRVPIPLGATTALKNIHRILKSGGVLRAQDYGFLNYGILPSYARMSSGTVGSPYGNMLKDGYAFVGTIINDRKDGRGGVGGNLDDMQASAMVNFPFLRREAKRMGMKVRAEPLTLWVERTLGRGHAFGSYHGVGLAYKVRGLSESSYEKSLPPQAFSLIGEHPALKENSPLLKGILRIIDEEGDTSLALQKSLNHLEENGIKLKFDNLPPKKPNETKYVISAIANFIVKHLAGTNGLVARIKAKAEIVDPTASIGKIDSSHERKFQKEIGELEALGFGKRSIRWVLFQQPYSHRVSGALARVSFTAIKR